MKLSGSQCHWHHLYILKWKERKDLPYYRRKSQMCLLSSAEWNELNILNAELHFDYCLKKESRKQPPIPTQAPLHFFFSFICYWSKWGQLLETSVQPWMLQLWLSRRLLHLIYLFGIYETLFSSQSGAPSLIASLYGVRHSTVSTEPAGGNLQEAQETWERTQRFQFPSPSSGGWGHWKRWERAEMQQKTVWRTDLPSFRH